LVIPGAPSCGECELQRSARDQAGTRRSVVLSLSHRASQARPTRQPPTGRRLQQRNPSHPRYTSLFKQALKIADANKRFSIIHEMQQLDYSDGAYIIPFCPPVIDGLAVNVPGPQATGTGHL
jgi:ABC-type transport system substrate-binding protein